MKIVFQHDGILPVKKYGGIERIIYWHMKKLVELGHSVIMIGNPNSDLKSIGVELIPTKENWEDLIPSDADIIHLYYNYIAKSNVPTIIQIQGNGRIGEEFPENTVFLTKKHASNHGSEAYVYNAIDLSEYPYNPEKKFKWDNFLFLAKGSWSVKNLKGCIKAAKKNKKHLHIAGGKALLPSRYMHNYGMVGGSEKLEIMNKCDALLFPVRWHEPFGIAIIEAMALGLPVIGGPYGSLPELINADTGIIVNSQEELNQALSKPKVFDHQKIRKYIEGKFSFENYTHSFLDLYNKVISGEKINQKKPSWNQPQEAIELLPF